MAKNKNTTQETGRSMVEILAVLAVIGVLSVAGVEGYSYAMKKNEANNVAEKVSILAHEVSQQMMRGHTPEDVEDLVQDVKIKSARYNPNTKQYEKGNTQPDPEKDDRFALEVEGLDPKVGEIFLNSIVGAEPGLQKVQQEQDGTIQDITGTQDLDETSGSVTLGLVFSKDLSDTCPAGEYKVDDLCQEATGNNISSGDGVLKECGKATKPNSEHTECINCEAGENCGCGSQMSSGYGHCVDCVKNSNCGSDKWCDTNGNCFACPDNGTCSGDKTGFTCPEGYQNDGRGCCPNNATCTYTNGNVIVTCHSGYYPSEGICKTCPENAKSCNADGVVCHELYYLKDGLCRSCVQDIKDKIPLTSNTDFAKEIDQCNATCPAGKYAELITGDSIYNLSGSKCIEITAEKKDVSNPALKPDYILPTFLGNYFQAQSWCRAKGATLLEHSKYTSEVKEILDSIASWNIGRYWANGSVNTSSYCANSYWPGFRSTRWQCNGSDAPGNSLYFVCEKNK